MIKARNIDPFLFLFFFEGGLKLQDLFIVMVLIHGSKEVCQFNNFLKTNVQFHLSYKAENQTTLYSNSDYYIFLVMTYKGTRNLFSYYKNNVNYSYFRDQTNSLEVVMYSR